MYKERERGWGNGLGAFVAFGASFLEQCFT